CDDVVAVLQHRAPPLALDVRLEQHAVVPVVVRRSDPSVDLGGGEGEPAPLAQRDDLLHGHDVAHRGRTLSFFRTMPIYEYRCEKGHTFEVIQRMSEDALETCEVCAAPATR